MTKKLGRYAAAALAVALMACGLIYLRNLVLPGLRHRPNPYSLCIDHKNATAGETWVQETECEIAADKADGAKSVIDQLAWRTELEAAALADRGAISVGDMDRVNRSASQWAAK